MDAEFNEKCANEALMLHLESELESLCQENNRLRFQLHTILDQKEAELKRLREALEKIVKEGRYPGSSRLTAHIAEEALNPPKRS